MALTGLGGATIIASFGAGFYAPASAAAPSISVSSSPSTGVKVVGTSGADSIVLSRAGTATAPLINVDATTPLSVQSGCQPVAGDPTRALCTAPLVSSTLLRPVTIDAGAGNDLIGHGASLAIPLIVIGGAGDDTINAGPGQDTLDGGSENDTLRGGDALDTLIGGPGNDILDGGPGLGDELSGGSGDDTLLGGSGNADQLDGGPGRDRMDGGLGASDLADYSSRTSGVAVNLNNTKDPIQGAVSEGDTILGVENVNGGTGNDSLFGDANDNVLFGDAGDDTILGGLGEDTVVGFDGDDVLSGNTLPALTGPFVPNADGKIDLILGQKGTDLCVKSDLDPDEVAGCETVIIQN